MALLLSVNDFGIAGIGLMVWSFFVLFSDMGLNSSLIQREKEEHINYYNTVFTAEIIRGSITFVLILITLPFMGFFFNEPDAWKIIMVMGISQLFISFSNPAIISLYKSLEYKKLFWYNFSSDTFECAVTIMIAVFYKSYWAIAAGFFMKRVLMLIMSYRIVNYNPKLEFNLEKFKKLFNYGFWVYLTTNIQFFSGKGIDLLISKILGIYSFGLYQFSYNIAFSPLIEMNVIIKTVLWPALSNVKNNIEQFVTGLSKIFHFVLIISLPIIIVLIFSAKQILNLFWGDKWLAAEDIIKLLAINSVFVLIGIVLSNSFNALDKPKVNTINSVITGVSILIVGYFFISYWKIQGALFASLIVNAISSLSLLIYFMAKYKIQLRNLFPSLINILVSNLFLLIFYYGILYYEVDINNIYYLSIIILVGLIAYFSYWYRYKSMNSYSIAFLIRASKK